MIRDTCTCGATFKVDCNDDEDYGWNTAQVRVNQRIQERHAHDQWLKAHAACRELARRTGPEDRREAADVASLEAEVQRLRDLIDGNELYLRELKIARSFDERGVPRPLGWDACPDIPKDPKA